MIAAMQISPSLSVLSALSASGQAQGGSENRRTAGGRAGDEGTPPDPGLPATFERPPEGTPIRRGAKGHLRTEEATAVRYADTRIAVIAYFCDRPQSAETHAEQPGSRHVARTMRFACSNYPCRARPCSLQPRWADVL